MSLTPGTRLGSYEITSAIGAGGMGEVYRATDSHLKRSIAIKVLPAAVAADADRLARFQREAEVLAALNHPNIAAIYGLEKTADFTALVMELVDGEDLSQRIARAAIPLDEALPIARQIAEALEAAHEQGIVHRDLKPANIKVRADGTVKVLDFGLAKAMDPGSGSSPSVTMSPTMLSPTMSGAGVLLGTAAYMAPEQAKGRAVDKRADIWAFGVVLHEMLTGQPLFAADTVPETLAHVMTRPIDLGALPAATPRRVRDLLARCLDKDPKRRLRDIGEARIRLEELINGVAEEPSRPLGPDQARGRRVGLWVPVVVALLGALILALRERSTPTTAPEPPVVRFQIERSPDVYNRTASAFAMSPDGLRLAYYAAGSDGPQTLVVRTLATGEVRSVAGSATTTPLRDSIFWSPDSQRLVRGSAAGAEVFDLSTGAVRLLCECRYTGGSWNQDGTILLGAFSTQGISRFSAGDSKPVEITKVDSSRGERDTFPAFLPDGRRFLFTRSAPGAEDATYVGTLEGDAPQRIAAGSRRVVVPVVDDRGSYLLGIDSAGLVAQPFDLTTAQVTGPATTLIGGVVAVSASQRGILATSGLGTRSRSVPTWFDRTGTSHGQIGEPALIDGIALSLDGRKLARSETEVGPRGNQVSTIWLEDVASGARTHLTFTSASTPVWSPAATTLAFTSSRGRGNVQGQLPYQRAADGTGGEVPLFPYDWFAWVNDWSRDGNWVIFSTTSRDGAGSNDLWAVSMAAGSDHKPIPYLVEPRLQQQAQFSPDGRFVAYGSDESGTFEIYVQPFPHASDGKWMVSSGGGVEPRWSPDGKELFYFSGQTLMAVPVRLQPTFSGGAPRKLFDAPVRPGYTQDSHRWQVAPDGRFLVLADVGNSQTPLDVIVNWPALLAQRPEGGTEAK